MINDDNVHDRNIRGDYIHAFDFGRQPELSGVCQEAMDMAVDVIQILREYNLRKISPRKLVEMTARLHKINAVSLEEFNIISLDSSLHPADLRRSSIYLSLLGNPDCQTDLVEKWRLIHNELRDVGVDPKLLTLIAGIAGMLCSFQGDR